MTYVTMVFQRVFGTRRSARKAYAGGAPEGALDCLERRREPAESYVEQLQGYLLLATLEKAQ